MTQNHLTKIAYEMPLSRRRFLKSLSHLGLTSLVPGLLLPKKALTPDLPEGFILPSPFSSETLAPPKGVEFALSLYNTHTGESLKNHVFWAEGKFIKEQLTCINRLFRDHRTNEIHPIDPQLLKLLVDIQKAVDTKESIHLISGYRSFKTNNMLAGMGKGVARKSQHLLGKAADIRIPHRQLKYIQRAAAALKKGGVGRYTNFVHIDTGRVRTWGLK